MNAFDLFDIFTQSNKYYTFHCHIWKSTDISKMWFMKWTVKPNVLLSGRFTAKFELVFVLTWKTLFLRGSILKPTERTGFSKKRYEGFSKYPSIWEIGVFLCGSQWKFWTFSILQLWNKFSGKRKPFLKNRSTVF